MEHQHQHSSCKHGQHPEPHESNHRAAKPAAQKTEVIYTCPMHPQIRRMAPGFCPICGMALEPVVAAAELAANPELTDMTPRFWIALVLRLPVIALGMVAELLGLNHSVNPVTSAWIQFGFATPVVLWAG